MSDLVENFSKRIIEQQYQVLSDNPELKENILLIENYYTNIQFEFCNINIFALKKIIKWNLKSLRSIKINRCIFHLSDGDANEFKNPVSNGRMLQEIDFVYLIQTFQFFDIEEIELNLTKEQQIKFINEQYAQKVQLKDIRDKKIVLPQLVELVPASSQVQIEMNQGHEVINFEADKEKEHHHHHYTENTMSEQDLIEQFGCEKECRLINYEQIEKPSFIKSFQHGDQKKFAQDLIWGDLINPLKMDDQLNINKISEIQQNLSFYKTYTKYALMDNKLLILGDVLYNNVSQQQLYNLIQLNYMSINSIIFKDTGRIPSKSFSDLMNQLFIIEKIDEISFLASVVEEESFKDLQYLIGSKKVQFMIIYRSHFLASEIYHLFQMHATKKTPLMHDVNINHYRYTILDLFSKTYYEFTPYAFQSSFASDFLSKSELEKIITNNQDNFQTAIEYNRAYSQMMEAEKLYERQQDYPKLIYNRIIFYQGKNLSIIGKNVSEKILFKYWIFVKKANSKQEIDQIKKAKLDIKQDELINDLDKFINQDDLNVVNCSLINILIGFIQEKELKIEYQQLYRQQKSYKILQSKYPISIVENIRYSQKYYLQTAVAYLRGFTKIKGQSLYFFINNDELHRSLCENRWDFSNFETEEYSLIIKESVKIGLNAQLVGNLTQIIDFNKLTHLNLDGIRENTTYSYLSDVFQAAINLRVLTMRECLLNMKKISSINFGLVSKELQELDLSKNREIDDFSLLNNIMAKATFLKKLALQDMQINQSRLKNVNFSLLSKSLENLNLSNNNLTDCIEIVASLITETSSLKIINLAQCQLTNHHLKKIKFPVSIEYLNISQNYNLEFGDFIDILPTINQPNLTYLELKDLNINLKSEKSQTQIKQSQSSLNNIEEGDIATHSQNNSQIHSNHPSNPSIVLKHSSSSEKYMKIEEIIFHQNKISEVSKVNEILIICKNMKKFTISYQEIDDQQISLLKLDHLYDKLIKIDISNNYQIKKCDFLNKLFEQLVNLKQFIMRYCSLTQEKIKNVNFSLISEGLEEFDLSGNPDISNLGLLNDLMKKCQKLKILSLDQMKLTDEKLKNVDFSLISPFLEKVSLSSNDNSGQLTRFYFLNEIMRKAKTLKIINLQGITLNEVQIDNISFDNVSPELEIFRIQEGNEGNKRSLTDWLIKKLNRYLNIYRFQKRHANADLFPYLNYFGICQSFNLTQYRMSKEEINFKHNKTIKEEDKQENKTQQVIPLSLTNIVHIDLFIKQKQEKRMSLLNQSIQQKKQQYTFNQEQRIHLSEAVNIFYFYSFFKKFEQMINQENSLVKQGKEENESDSSPKPQIKSKEQWNFFFDQVIEDQNVYIDVKYLLLHYINDKKMLEQLNLDLDTLEPENLIQFIKVLDLSNRKYFQNAFIIFTFTKCKLIQKMCLQKMQLQVQEFFEQVMFEEQMHIHLCSFEMLEEVNLSDNQVNLSKLINAILLNAPHLKILNLSNSNLNNNTMFKVDLLPISLIDLNLSNNQNFQSIAFLNNIFKICTKLKNLNLSNMNLDDKKFEEVHFNEISSELEILNLSDNNQKQVAGHILSSIFTKCKKLQIVNVSNFGIHHNYIKQNLIKFSELSSHLREINLSRNSIVYFMGFLTSIFKASPHLEKLDLSYQQHINSYQSEPVNIPANKLKYLNISGNLVHDSFQYAPEIITQSSCFVGLLVQDFNLNYQRLNSLFDEKVTEKIEELDISNNNVITDLTNLNQLNKKAEFKSLIARNTCLNNYLISQLDKQAIFTNLQKLDFAYNLSILDYSFFNDLFKIAINLKSLNISYMQATQEMIGQIDFSQTPLTLENFDISGNEFINNFEFLNKMFERTKKTLKNLYMSQMNLDEKQLQNINFEILVESIEYIDFSKNPNLKQIDFMLKFFNDSSVKLQKVKLDTFSHDFEQGSQLQYVEKLECEHIKYKYNFFTQEKYVANINIIKFIRFLQNAFKRRNEILRNSDGSEDKFWSLFKLFLQQMLLIQSKNQNLQVLLHFFFLLFNEEKLKIKEKQEKFFIFSPYSMFQKSKIKKDKVINQLKGKALNFDSYNLAFFDLDLVEHGMNYIFSYDKFYFPHFNEFYFQDFKSEQLGENGVSGDVLFLENMNQLIEIKQVEQAFLPLKITISDDILKQKNLDEFTLLYYLNRVPPSAILLKNMSIQFVKSWYVINYYAPLSYNTQIEVDFELIENTSIGNYLTLNSYKMIVQNYREKSFSSYIKYFIGQIGYFIFSIFQTQPMQFRFDHSVILLERQFGSIQQARFNLLRFLFPIYQFVCIFGVIFFSTYNQIACHQGISWYSYIMYGVYGLLTFIIEADLFVLCLEFVNHLIPEFKPDCQTAFPNNYINSTKQFLIDLNWLNTWYLNYSISFIQSQITRFDYFTDISFLYSLYTCDERVLFWISFTALSIHLLFNVILYILTFSGESTYGKLVTGRIDKLYQICNLVQFQAVAEVLNIISPSNSITYKKRMYNQKIVSTFIGILFENIPQIIIQIIYLAKNNTITINVLFSIITSCLMFVINLYKFLTVVPSRLGQEDFNALNTKKRNQVLPVYQKKLQEYESNLLKYNLVEQLKCIKSTLYYKSILEKNFNSISDIHKEIQVAKDLRRFQHNLDLIDYFFQNKIFIDKQEQLEEFKQKYENLLNNEITSQTQLEKEDKQNKNTHGISHFKPSIQLNNNNHQANNSHYQHIHEDLKDTTHLVNKKLEMPHDQSSAYLNKSNQILHNNNNQNTFNNNNHQNHDQTSTNNQNKSISTHPVFIHKAENQNSSTKPNHPATQSKAQASKKK
ncbi:transmembrane protein, putative (macronuclear) [Tetrahymena thermophila SB210]|uniref:Transmembrane protein, putative n=1 Tax=Tetrahymena thermophila (strain SB210) TaxID=312017 RepID=Q22SL8_TETTS|nr:transmembrane protein, putative [Tetrahymena thermophila SB210]EAR87754.2 transmembrane protein, putative [Tetrahymena thermophila SB210]|eukprot:XP_001007999.2 transmembrane protein, putative [Tetrahymena thermophila SB210]